MTTSPQIRKACAEAVELAREWLDDLDPMFEGDDKTTLARELLRLAAANEAMCKVYEAALDWADSTRVWPPEGDDDALNCLLEMAQDAYNKSGRHPASVIVSTAALAAEGGSGDE